MLPPRAPVKGAWSAPMALDPITSLLAFPTFHTCFHRYFKDHLANGEPVGIAVGDVDNLKRYVENTKTRDPKLFGHLAGNALMSELGRTALDWLGTWSAPWTILSTFGGDEIIMACAGTSRRDFMAGVESLCDMQCKRLPCTVSFACGWFVHGSEPPASDAGFYDHYVDALVLVDRALFGHKLRRKKSGRDRLITCLSTRRYTAAGWTRQAGDASAP
jgi:GGDEF domain-containing protein